MILAGLAGFSVAVPWGPFWAIPICALLQGAGFGLMWGFLVRRIVDAVQPAERPLAAAALPTIQQIGFAVGAALCGIVANLAGFNDTMAQSRVVSVAAWVFGAFVPVAVLAVLSMWRFTRR
jgi:MFS family permease